MRLLIFHPHLDIKGGSERLSKILAEEAKRLGYEVKIFAFTANKSWFPDVEIVRKDELRHKAQEFKPDYTLIALPESMYAKSLKNGCKLGMYVHFPIEEEVDEYNFNDYKARGRALYVSLEDLKLIDILFTNSKRSSMAIRNVWNIEPKIVYPPIDRVFIDDSRRYMPENNILYVARFTPLKRQDFLLLAYKIIKEQIKDARLTLAGFRDYRHREYYMHVKDIADRLGVDMIESPSDDELLNLYKEAKVYAHPRIGEHFGISPCESMALGTPAVVRAPSGLGEIVKDIVALSDWSFIDRIKHILSMQEDEWVKVSNDVRDKVKVCYPEVFAKRLLGYFEEL